MGTNASYFIPNEVARHHDVMIVEGPTYEAEIDLIVVEKHSLNIQQVDERDIDKRFVGLCKFISDFKPDIIHIFYHHQALELGKAIRKKFGTKVRLLLDIRTPLLEDKFSIRSRVQLKNIRFQKSYNMIATHSLYSVKTVFPICLLPVREVSYGVDQSAFHVRSKAWQKNNIDLVYTGAIAKKRKIGQLLIGFKALVEMGDAKSLQFKLHLYGSGNRINEMKALAKQLHIQSQVVFHGVVNQSELAKDLHNYAIGIGYVPFGIYKQAPALKTLEYMCAGLNVLASNTQPTKDLTANGFRLNTYDNSASGFANGILEICNKGWDEEVVKKNHELVSQYDWKTIVQKSLLPIYQELADM